MSGSGDLLKQALSMSRRERAAMASALLRTLEDAPDDPAAEQLWDEEIERRLGELSSGAVGTMSWDEVRESMLAREKERGA